MNEHDDAISQESETPAAPTQEALYDDLRRIGQLEDEKRAIQQEIDQRTERLQNAVPALDRDSLLYRLLTNALPARRAPKKRPARVAKKTVKKK